MAALLKYFAGIAVILPVVMALFAVNMGEIFVGIAAIAQPPVTETPRWNIKRLRAEPNAAYIVHGIIKPDLSGNSRQRTFGKTSQYRKACEKAPRAGERKIELTSANHCHCTNCRDRYMRNASKTGIIRSKALGYAERSHRRRVRASFLATGFTKSLSRNRRPHPA